MPVVVVAKAPAEYAQWINDQERIAQELRAEEERLLAMNMSKEELMTIGQRSYTAVCAACHQPNGEGLPGVFPALKNSPLIMNDLAGHIDIVLNGRTGTAMQSFSKQLTMSEIAAVVTYTRNAWGNNTGDVVQAKDVNAAMQGE